MCIEENECAVVVDSSLKQKSSCTMNENKSRTKKKWNPHCKAHKEMRIKEDYGEKSGKPSKTLKFILIFIKLKSKMWKRGADMNALGYIEC